jgi:diguanylate cyclase
MAVIRMPYEEMRAALAELKQALYSHEQWSEAFYATLTCRLAPDERDVDKESHRKCRFGQWLYGPGAARLQSHPGFIEVVTEHERMHRFVVAMLLAVRDNTPISTVDYEHFSNALKRMRLELLTLIRELEDAIYNLDPLTGAASRIGMLTKLREQQELVKRKVQSCCIAMMDLDLFKAVNDTYGHNVGDRVLAAVAHHTSACLRPYDKVFRYGGEEFLICLPDSDLEIGLGIIERLQKELASLSHETEGGGPVSLTVSFGLALLDPDVPVEQSIDRADKALYSAKASGRNRTVIWTASEMPATPSPGS